MSTATLHIGDVFDVLDGMPDGSVNSVITSPPYWRQRAYLPDDDPSKAREIGQEASPGEFLAVLLRLTDELWRVVRDDGTIWFDLGDTSAGSGGAGGDYDVDGQREGQNRYSGNRAGGDAPRAKSVCWLPQLFGASLAYGRNLLTGEPCRQWITRPPVTWCKPAPTPGAISDKFRPATELIVWAAKRPDYYFDLDSVREPPKKDWGNRVINSSAFRGHPREKSMTGKPDRACNPKGVPPLNWWPINSPGYAGAHFATFPPELVVRPVIVSCPPGGIILDPFAGSGTTGQVAVGHGRDCWMIDFDRRNIPLISDRVGFFLDVVEDTNSSAAS